MLKTYIVRKQFYFLAAGTILKKSGMGDYYFVSMSDEDMLSSRIVTRPLIEGGTVEANKEYFLDVTGKELDLSAFACLKNLLELPPVAPIDYSTYQFGVDVAQGQDVSVITVVRPPQVHKIDPLDPKFWPGSYVVSKYKNSHYYGSIPAGTIFKLGSRLTVNKPMKSIPCAGCGVSFDLTFKGSRENFLKMFDFVLRTDGPEVPFTQSILLGDKDATTE